MVESTLKRQRTRTRTLSTASGLLPPACNNMFQLDKIKFELTVKCSAAEVPATSCTTILKKLNGACSKFSHLQLKPKVVLPCEHDASRRLILLDENHVSDEIIIAEEGIVKEIDIKLTYKNWSASQIMRAILPDSTNNNEFISSFEVVGQIAHLNLKECHQQYKYVIGQVILDKNPYLKTVVNKLDTIHSQYRYFDMEVIAGEENFITTAVEHKIKYTMDYSKVYWNSKLSSEHKRIVDLIPSGSIVLDMFCGIGPFALPLAKKKCNVHANDLNPESYRYLQNNIKLNKIPLQHIHCYKEDGRNFIRSYEGQIDFVIMNLPASAVDFLDTFRGLYNGREEGQGSGLPTVFCYHFTDMLTPKKNAIKTVCEKLGCSEAAFKTPPEVHLVRKTAPKTWMTCVEFIVPHSVLYNEQEGKRLKLTEERT